MPRRAVPPPDPSDNPPPAEGPPDPPEPQDHQPPPEPPPAPALDVDALGDRISAGIAAAVKPVQDALDKLTSAPPPAPPPPPQPPPAPPATSHQEPHHEHRRTGRDRIRRWWFS